jgi:hypothetical protein
MLKKPVEKFGIFIFVYIFVRSIRHNNKTNTMKTQDLNIERQIVTNEINNLKSMISDLSKYDSISAKFQVEDFTEILNDKIKYEKTLY